MLLKKIDSEGNYTEFPGVTVIASVGNQNQELWLGIYQFLRNSTVLLPYFKPLPYESYHMTTQHLYTQRAHFNNWVDFINSKLGLLQQLYQRLTKTPFRPELSIENMNSIGSLQLNVSIPPKQYDLITSIANEFGLQKMIPRVFHITLAYEYKMIEHESDYVAVQQEIATLLSLCLKHQQKLLLNPPQLCFFHSMEQFILWDATTNPFTENHITAPILDVFEPSY